MNSPLRNGLRPYSATDASICGRKWSRGLLALLGACLFLPATAHAERTVMTETGELVVNTSAGFAYHSSIAQKPNRDYIVVWKGCTNSDVEICARRLTALGTPVGSEFQVNTVPGADRQGIDSQSPGVAATDDGGFVVAWSSDTDQLGAPYDNYLGLSVIFARRFDSTNMPIGSEFRVTELGNDIEVFSPAVESLPGGGFVVAWYEEEFEANFTSQVKARYYASDGTPLAAPFVVNSDPPGERGQIYGPDTSVDGVGNVTFTYSFINGLTAGFEAAARRYDSSGSPIGTEFTANSINSGNQDRPAVDANDEGSFVIAWAGQQDGSDTSVQAQRFNSSGGKVGGEFTVNSGGGALFTNGWQYPRRGSVLVDPSGDFTVVWNDDDADQSGPGIFFRTYDDSGSAITSGTPFVANGGATSGAQRYPSIAGGEDEFVITWTSPVGSLTTPSDVIAKKFFIAEDFAILVDPDPFLHILTTDDEEDGATPEDPVETIVQNRLGGTTRIVERSINVAAPDGWVFFGTQVEVSNMGITTTDLPHLFTFVLDPSVFPPGRDASNIAIFKDGIGLFECADGDPLSFQVSADPDPCIDVRNATAVPDQAIFVKSTRDGVFHLAVNEPMCGNGAHEINEQCDDGADNGTARSCCQSDCQFKPNGNASCDGLICTRPDTCTDGVCTPGVCADGQACSPCGGTCVDTGSACECQ